MKRWVAIICLVGMGMFLSLWWAGQQLVVRANSVMTVDMVADEVDLTPGDGLCLTASGGCSLRAAIQEANVLSGTDTVVVPAGVYLLSLDGEEGDSVAGDLNIKDDLILLGAGIDETIVTGNGGDRLWQVGVDVVVTVQDMSWQGGNATLLASPNGGGVKNQGDLRLINVIVANSQGVCGGGIYNSGQLTLAYTKVVTNSATGNGGGICNMGVLTATDTLLAYNESLVDLLGGGGLYSSHVVRMARSLVTHNVALFGNGGGLAIENGSLWLDQSWIYHNEAEVLGGGIVGGTSWLTITNSTIAANTVWGETGTAGGIGQFGGEVLMVNSSVSGNRADVGGGLFSVGDIEMAYVTVVDNVADTAIGGMVFNGTMSVVRSSVVGNNVGGNCDGVLVSGGYNVSSDWGCGFVAEGDIQGVAVGVEPLGDNGGPMTPGGVVPTHYPNIEAIWRDIIPVGVNGCGEEMAVDGRGLPRPFASACDSGAVEAFDVMGVVEGGTIMEGNNGLTSLPFTVTLSSLPLVTRTLFYTTVGGTADVDSDYLYRTGSVVVPPNQSEVSWSIPVVNDNVAEETETVVLAVGGRERFWLESTEVVGTILDGDAANQIEVVDWFIWEGHEGATTAWFTVTLTQAAEEVVTVDYLLTEGTATAGEDYEGGYGTITWQIGEQAVLVPVLVYCDYDVESDETVLLLLSGAEGGVLIDNMGVGVIGNDDEEVEPVSWSVYLPGVLKE